MMYTMPKNLLSICVNFTLATQQQQDFLWRHLADGAAQLLEGSLFDTGDIAARQVHTAGDLVLRQWSGSAETVPQPDDLALARAERGEERAVHRIIAVVIVHGVQSLVLAADRILKRKRIAVAVGLERIRKRDLAGRSALAAEVHQQLVLDTLGGIGSQTDAALRPKGVDRLDQTDRSDGNKIVAFCLRRVVFFDDMRNKPEIMLDQEVSRGCIAFLAHFLQQLRFFLGGERPGKAAVRPLHAQSEEEKCAAERRQSRKQQIKDPFPCVCFSICTERGD